MQGQKLKQKPSIGRMILLAVAGIYFVWCCVSIIAALGNMSSRYGTWTTAAATINLSVNLWGLAAFALLVLITKNPDNWGNGKRLSLGGLALAIALGRLSGGLLESLAALNIPGAAVFLATPFVLLIAGALTIFTLFMVAGLIFGFFVAIPAMLFNQLFAFEREIAVYRYRANGLSGYIARFIYWLRNEPLPAAPPDESRGARLATTEEAAKLRHFSGEDAMSFGHYDFAPFFIKTEKHVLVMASTRSGKGVTVIIPHLLRYSGSAFVLDPKGENAKATGRQREQLNDRVHYLDPFGISGKPQSRFNPLAHFTPENMEAESKALAAALFISGDKERDHWNAAGQQLLALLILYAYVSPKVPPHRKDLPYVRKLLLGELKETLAEMVTMDEADGLLCDLSISFRETPEKELGSIVSTAQRQTEILDNPYIAACLSAAGAGDEVDFAQWHSGTMTVYLCLSAPKFPTFNRWLRLLLTAALDEMTNNLNPPAMPVCFMLDELATLGHLTAVENAIGLAAGYGVQLVTIFQDVAQMRDLYKGRWASFVGNAGVRALFNLDDYDTAKYWSDFVGGRVIDTRSRHLDNYGYSNGENVSEAVRPLYPPEKMMMEFAADRMLVLPQGVPPIITERVPYWKDESLTGRWDDPRIPTPPPPKLSRPKPPTPAVTPSADTLDDDLVSAIENDLESGPA